jgi:nucleotide-binding universal stress UspA family protein
MYKRILVVTDGSPFSEPAVVNALSLAKLCGAQLLALHVVPHYPRSYLEGGLSLSEAEIHRTEQQWLDKGQALVDAVRTRGQQAGGVDVMPLCAKASPISEAILTAASQHQCDLIVMASHGRKGMARLLLGSETQQVLAHASIPVLVVRSGAAKGA